MDTNRATVVAEPIAGLSALNLEGALSAYIQPIWVAPDLCGHGSHGIGPALIGFAEARISQNTPNVCMYAAAFNMPVRHLYEPFGYRAAGERSGWIVAGHMQNLMRKTFAPLADGQHRGAINQVSTHVYPRSLPRG